VQVKVFDVTGREVYTLANRAFQAGEHSLTWDGRDNSGSQVARGVYFARVI
jgi:flagellar hook assembly protein FlgD